MVPSSGVQPVFAESGRVSRPPCVRGDGCWPGRQRNGKRGEGDRDGRESKCERDKAKEGGDRDDGHRSAAEEKEKNGRDGRRDGHHAARDDRSDRDECCDDEKDDEDEDGEERQKQERQERQERFRTLERCVGFTDERKMSGIDRTWGGGGSTAIPQESSGMRSKR